MKMSTRQTLPGHMSAVEDGVSKTIALMSIHFEGWREYGYGYNMSIIF